MRQIFGARNMDFAGVSDDENLPELTLYDAGDTDFRTLRVQMWFPQRFYAWLWLHKAMLTCGGRWDGPSVSSSVPTINPAAYGSLHVAVREHSEAQKNTREKLRDLFTKDIVPFLRTDTRENLLRLYLNYYTPRKVLQDVEISKYATCSTPDCVGIVDVMISRGCDNCDGPVCNCQSSVLCLPCLLDLLANAKTWHAPCPMCLAQFCFNDIVHFGRALEPLRAKRQKN